MLDREAITETVEQGGVLMQQLVFATKNQHKLTEIRQIMQDLPYSIVGMEEIGIDIDVVEDGKSFEENAIKKATEIMRHINQPVLADDSGFEIDYLDKQPGIYSARYLGVDTPYQEKNRQILEQMAGVAQEQRTARFICVVAAAYPDGRCFTTKGVLEGRVALAIQGENGFGYDPIFYVPEYGMTTAQMPAQQKNQISHRGKALAGIKEKIAEHTL